MCQQIGGQTFAIFRIAPSLRPPGVWIPVVFVYPLHHFKKLTTVKSLGVFIPSQVFPQRTIAQVLHMLKRDVVEVDRFVTNVFDNVILFLARRAGAATVGRSACPTLRTTNRS